MALNFEQKKTLVAYEHFYGNRYKTHSDETGNTRTHVETQKMCYLLKMVGIEIGQFAYSWNIKGPFSPGLLATLRTIDRVDDEVTLFYETSSEKDMILSEHIDEIINIRQKLEIDKHEKDIVQWVELLGSLVYISRTMLPGSQFEIVENKLQSEKPEYNDSDYNRYAWEILTRMGLLSKVVAE